MKPWFMRQAALLAVLLAVAGAPVSGTEPTEIDYWDKRLSAALKARDAQEEVLCLTTLGRRWGHDLRRQPDWVIRQVAHDAQVARLGEPRAQMLQLLYDLRWKWNDGSEPSGFWRELSLALLERSDRSDAFAVAAHITDPYELVALQADNRYRAILRSGLVERNIEKAARREIDAWQERVRQGPRSLRNVARLGGALLRLPRYQEVLSLTDHALARAGPGDAAAYDDVAQELPQVLAVRAEALEALGRCEDAIAERRRARETAKPPAADAALGLAWQLIRCDRPQEASAALPAPESLTPRGLMWIQLIRAASAAELNDTAALAVPLDYLRQRRAEEPGLLLRALLACGQADESARVLVAQLRDPDLRAERLRELQDYAEPPAPARVAQWRALLQALRNRPEVRAVVADVGTVQRYPLTPAIF